MQKIFIVLGISCLAALMGGCYYIEWYPPLWLYGFIGILDMAICAAMYLSNNMVYS